MESKRNFVVGSPLQEKSDLSLVAQRRLERKREQKQASDKPTIEKILQMVDTQTDAQLKDFFHSHITAEEIDCLLRPRENKITYHYFDELMDKLVVRKHTETLYYLFFESERIDIYNYGHHFCYVMTRLFRQRQYEAFEKLFKKYIDNDGPDSRPHRLATIVFAIMDDCVINYNLEGITKLCSLANVHEALSDKLDRQVILKNLVKADSCSFLRRVLRLTGIKGEELFHHTYLSQNKECSVLELAQNECGSGMVELLKHKKFDSDDDSDERSEAEDEEGSGEEDEEEESVGESGEESGGNEGDIIDVE